jgi:hypothetical protein
VNPLKSLKIINFAKVEVAGSNPVSRSISSMISTTSFFSTNYGQIRAGLKRPVFGVKLRAKYGQI